MSQGSAYLMNQNVAYIGTLNYYIDGIHYNTRYIVRQWRAQLF